jgi:hypothetical protein
MFDTVCFAVSNDLVHLAVAKVSTGREEQRGSNQGQRKESRFSDSLGDLVLKWRNSVTASQGWN